VGQQPNIDLQMANLPRPTDPTAEPRRWAPGRVGEVRGPDDVPRGGRFGTPGPDAGYALTLLAEREIATAPGERRRDAMAAIAAVMSARASALGRAPVAGDAEVAEVILGYAGPAAGHTAEARAAAITGMAHHRAATRALIVGIDRTALVGSFDEVASRAAAGETLVRF
jgi:hypothetical protein